MTEETKPPNKVAQIAFWVWLVGLIAPIPVLLRIFESTPHGGIGAVGVGLANAFYLMLYVSFAGGLLSPAYFWFRRSQRCRFGAQDIILVLLMLGGVSVLVFTASLLWMSLVGE